MEAAVVAEVAWPLDLLAHVTTSHNTQKLMHICFASWRILSVHDYFVLLFTIN